MIVWAVISACLLLFPMLMIFIGLYMRRRLAFKDISYFSGYRTRRSTKNKDTWYFANSYCGRLMLYLGIIFLPLSVAAIIALFGLDETTTAIRGALIITGQSLLITIPIIPTEIALRKRFDINGKRLIES